MLNHGLFWKGDRVHNEDINRNTSRYSVLLENSKYSHEVVDPTTSGEFHVPLDGLTGQKSIRNRLLKREKCKENVCAE